MQCHPVLHAGVRIELTIAWPVREGKATGLKLHAAGQTVRAEANHTAVRIDRSSLRFDL